MLTLNQLNNPTLCIVIFLVVVQFTGYAAFYTDKRKAIHGKRRISEKSLLWICFVAPVGSIIAMILLRHKNKKITFLVKALVPIIMSIAFHIIIFKLLYNQSL